MDTFCSVVAALFVCGLAIWCLCLEVRLHDAYAERDRLLFKINDAAKNAAATERRVASIEAKVRAPKKRGR